MAGPHPFIRLADLFLAHRYMGQELILQLLHLDLVLKLPAQRIFSDASKLHLLLEIRFAVKEIDNLLQLGIHLRFRSGNLALINLLMH